MRTHLLLLLASATFVQADWKSDMLEQGTMLYENAKHKTVELYKELKPLAQSSIKTTKADYAKKIEELQEENLDNERRIEQIKSRLIQQFADIGVNLSAEQINVLLTRVDGDDIIQMATGRLYSAELYR